MAILLCAAPCSADYVVVDGTNSPYVLYDEDPDIIEVTVTGTLQIMPGGYASLGVYVNLGGTIEIYGSHTCVDNDALVQIADSANVSLFTDSTDSIVLDTESGDAALIGTTIIVDSDYGWTGKLTWAYEGTTYSLNISTLSNIIVEIVGGGEPLEAQLWVFPGIINRYGPLSKILAIVRLPEGITKDDIDSEQMLVLYAEDEDYYVEIEASCQQIIQWCINGTVRTTIFASFDKASLMAAVPDDGKVGLQVSGQLDTAESFCGSDTVTIVSWSW